MKEKLCVITGPTGIGKTNLSLELAKSLNGEIISADSMQIYKYMDIGTAKISPLEMGNVPHHLVDLIYPNEDFTVSDFKSKCKKIITEINQRKKLPIIVGGTGLYINSLVYDLNFTEVAFDPIIRDKYENLANEEGLKYLHKLLEDVDFVSSERISVNDKKRIIRALEIYDLTGKTMSDYNKDFRKENKDYNLVIIGLNMDRLKLYDRINKRVDIMIEQGLVEEVKLLLNIGYDPNSVALQGIGYKEIILYLDGRLTLEESIDLIKQKSRNYAKRQLTWFRRDSRIKWINVDEFEDFNLLKNFTQNYILENIN
ncbi:tRNA (adenosine(37)-N6)-dimethylallyltransferase MiaA [Tissierella creatinophila]|uniref:tRNA dimethylallyltransferase n=1 Tax=Tissierella creatinophila DSM 6911 TaxID=1123403 RepID=A0A1U7M9J3_TISCR|nr:tRNA dimethylallyltransferase [Tissierella creatinophila DSM 6911]